MVKLCFSYSCLIYCLFQIKEVEAREPAMSNDPMLTDSVIPMSPSVNLPSPLQLDFGTNLLLRMNVCYDPSHIQSIVTSVVSLSGGLFEVYVCSQQPCTTDSRNVLCSTNPLPLSTCMFPHKNDSYYINIYSTGGTYNPSTKRYVSDVRFSAYYE